MPNKLYKPGSRDCPVHGKEMPCYMCSAHNHAAKGPRRKQPLREKKPIQTLGYIVTGGQVDPSKLADWLRGLADDPVRIAGIEADGRRPGGVNRERFGVAIRAACGTPMLCAQPAEVFHALEGKTRIKRNARLDKAGVYKRIVVKPTTARTGAAGWGDRLWLVYNLKYSKGVVVVTDEGDESKVFPQYSELRKALLASGWSILK